MKKVLLLILALTILTLAACDGSSNSNAVTALAPVPPEYAGKTNPLGANAASAGADVFGTNCDACHGPQGHGDGPASAALDPAPKNLPELAKIVGDDYFFWRISTGKDGTSMVAWKGVLTDEQIWKTVAFISTLK
jgi:mono/diheme cytochrome c family protein